MEIDWNAAGWVAFSALFVVVPLGITLLVLLGKALRGQRLRGQVPGTLTLAEVRGRLHARGSSLASQRELAMRFAGQRVRWPCTLAEVYQSRGTLTAMCIGEPDGGQFFFDPARADGTRLEQTAQGTRMVVEGTLRVDLDHNLLTLDAPVVRFDLSPARGDAPTGPRRPGG